MIERDVPTSDTPRVTHHPAAVACRRSSPSGFHETVKSKVLRTPELTRAPAVLSASIAIDMH
jgi:hypothetical protein